MKDYVVFKEEQFIERVKMCMRMYAKEEGLSQDLDKIPIVISKRMTRCHGLFRYWPKTKSKPYRPSDIRFTDKMLDGRWTIEYVDQIIMHEVIHYILFMMGYYEESHGIIFKQACNKYNCRLITGKSTEEKSSEYTTVMESIREKNRQKAIRNHKHIISCMKCGYEIRRKAKPKNFVCKICGHEEMKVK